MAVPTVRLPVRVAAWNLESVPPGSLTTSPGVPVEKRRRGGEIASVTWDYPLPALPDKRKVPSLTYYSPSHTNICVNHTKLKLNVTCWCVVGCSSMNTLE